MTPLTGQLGHLVALYHLSDVLHRSNQLDGRQSTLGNLGGQNSLAALAPA